MPLRIGSDRDRFQQIIRGKIRKNLQQYISNEKLIGRKGGETVSIPIPHIETPRFRYNDKQAGGTGQGDGEPGDPLPGQGKPGAGQGAGQGEGEHLMEAEISMDELADILGEELQLPRIEPKGKAKILSESTRYNSIRRIGPEGLRSFKRTYKESLKRSLASGAHVPGRPLIPIKEDKRFRSAKTIEQEAVQASIIYMMDVSGSMGEREKSIVRTETFWIDTWLKRNYKGLETRYIIHDVKAKEVGKEEFFRTAESGGTQISSAYDLCSQIMETDYPASEWNVYTFHFSDGDNWSEEDTKRALDILDNEILPFSNMFGYGQVESLSGTGQFINDLLHEHRDHVKVATSIIRDRDEITQSIKDLLGKGL